jgi:hypothetical protein
VNRPRVVALLRELADAIEEDVPDEAPSRTRAKRVRRAPTLTRPAGEATPAVSGQATKILRERGFA